MAAADHYSVQEPPLEVFTLQEQDRFYCEYSLCRKLKKPFPTADPSNAVYWQNLTLLAGKRKIFKGPNIISTEHTQRVNLELKILITDTVHPFGYSISLCTLLPVWTPVQ